MTESVEPEPAWRVQVDVEVRVIEMEQVRCSACGRLLAVVEKGARHEHVCPRCGAKTRG